MGFSAKASWVAGFWELGWSGTASTSRDGMVQEATWQHRDSPHSLADFAVWWWWSVVAQSQDNCVILGCQGKRGYVFHQGFRFNIFSKLTGGTGACFICSHPPDWFKTGYSTLTIHGPIFIPMVSRGFQEHRILSSSPRRLCLLDQEQRRRQMLMGQFFKIPMSLLRASCSRNKWMRSRRSRTEPKCSGRWVGWSGVRVGEWLRYFELQFWCWRQWRGWAGVRWLWLSEGSTKESPYDGWVYQGGCFCEKQSVKDYSLHPWSWWSRIPVRICERQFDAAEFHGLWSQYVFELLSGSRDCRLDRQVSSMFQREAWAGTRTVRPFMLRWSSPPHWIGWWCKNADVHRSQIRPVDLSYVLWMSTCGFIFSFQVGL